MRWLWLVAGGTIAAITVMIHASMDGRRTELARATDYACGYAVAYGDVHRLGTDALPLPCQEVLWLARKLDVPRVGR